MEHSDRVLNRAVLALCLAGLALPVLFTEVPSSILPWVPSCPSRVWLNLPCPLCGVTRGIAALYQGSVTDAVLLNPLAPAILCLLLVEVPFRAWRSVAPVEPATARQLRRTDSLLHIILGSLYLLYAACLQGIRLFP